MQLEDHDIIDIEHDILKELRCELNKMERRQINEPGAGDPKRWLPSEAIHDGRWRLTSQHMGESKHATSQAPALPRHQQPHLHEFDWRLPCSEASKEFPQSGLAQELGI